MENPYASPQSKIKDADVTADGALDPLDVTHNIASRGQRLATYVLDTIFYYIIATTLGFMLGIYYGVRGIPGDANPGIGYLLGFLSVILYYVLQEALFGRTLGKLIAGTRVVTQDGRKPAFSQVLIRTLCRFIPFEPFSLLETSPVGWHDSLANTRVIRTRIEKLEY